MHFTNLLWTAIICTCVISPLWADEPSTAKEELQALIKEQQETEEAFRKAYDTAKSDDDRQRVLKEFAPRASPNSDYYAKKFLTLIRNHPKDPATLEAFRRMLTIMGYSPETAQALKLVMRDWMDDERLADVCQTLSHSSSNAGDTLLRTAIEKSPHRSVQGYARFALALSLKKRAERMANQRQMDRDPFERESAKLLQQVIDRYSDLKKHNTTLGKAAEPELFELRNLAIGKIPPELEAEDLDGKPMKLSDYRGKVVLLDFWGSW
jgi:hypothetical protein